MSAKVEIKKAILRYKCSVLKRLCVSNPFCQQLYRSSMHAQYTTGLIMSHECLMICISGNTNKNMPKTYPGIIDLNCDYCGAC